MFAEVFVVIFDLVFGPSTHQTVVVHDYFLGILVVSHLGEVVYDDTNQDIQEDLLHQEEERQVDEEPPPKIAIASVGNQAVCVREASSQSDSLVD